MLLEYSGRSARLGRLIPVGTVAAGLALLLASCTSTPSKKSSSSPPASSSSTASNSAAAGKVFYWIQGPKGIPVHRIAQYGFLQGCKENGMKCEVVGPDSGDLPPLVNVVNQVATKPDIAGVSLWSGGLPLFKQPLQAYADKNLPILIPHFYVDQGFYPGNVAVVSGDIQAGAANVANSMCKSLAGKPGSVAITQNGKNSTENMYSDVFAKTFSSACPNNKVLPVQLEGVDPAKAIAVAVGIIQANPNLVGALSTTGGGATTWAGAQKQSGKKLTIYGTDYTRENLALVKSGEVTGLLAQPVFEESREAAKLLKEMSAGQKPEYWTKLPIVVVTSDNLDTYLKLSDQVQAYADGLNK